MIFSSLHRWFGLGRIPNDMRNSIKEEGITLAEEGMSGSITFRNFRRPGKQCSWNRKGLVLSLFLTRGRLLCLSGKHTQIDIPYDDSRLKEMSFELKKDNLLAIGFDSALFHDDWSGTIEYRFKTAQASEFLKALERQGHVEQINRSAS